MATGDSADIASRLTAGLPAWFGPPGAAPVLDALLQGPRAIGTHLYDLTAYARTQTRIATAIGAWLDLVALDLFGARLRRKGLEADDAFRKRILAEVLRERGTRAALRKLILDLTGREPRIFEPRRPADCGAYGAGFNAAGYGVAGGWGNLDLPGQVFLDVYRSLAQGIPLVAGYQAWPAGQAFDPGISNTRSTTATYFDSTGTLQVAGPGTVRLGYDPANLTALPALIVEPARTNIIKNPRAEGAIAGSPGTLPSTWGGGGVSNQQIIGAFVEDGIPGLEFRTSTPSGSYFWLQPRAWSDPYPAAPGEIWTVSGYIKVQAGALGGTIPRFQVDWFDSGGTNIASTGINIAPTGAALRTQRLVGIATAPAGAVSVAMSFAGNFPAAPVDVTFRLGGLQLEKGSTATSLILPPVGSPDVATRAADSLTGSALMPSGYGLAARGEWASLSDIQGALTDADIYAAIDAVKPAGTNVWTRLSI